MAANTGLENSPGTGRPSVSGWDVVPPDRFGELLGYGDQPWSKSTVEQYIQRVVNDGDICVGTIRDGRVVAYAWMSIKYARNASVLGTFRLGPSWAYIYQLYVNRDYRGQSLGVEATQKCMDIAANLGIPRVFSYKAGGNVPALINARRAGFTEVGKTISIKIGKSTVAWPRLSRLRETFEK